jgi:transposase-like protein
MRISRWEIDEAVNAVRIGTPIKRVAERYGISEDYLRRLVKQAGVVYRQRRWTTL